MPIILVEGRHDVARIHEARPDLEAIAVGGSAIDPCVITQVKARKDDAIFLFLDPDSPGERIRGRLHEVFPKAKDLFIEKDKARSKNKCKVGIEHADIALIREILSMLPKPTPRGVLTMADMVELGLAGSNNAREMRAKLGALYHIGTTNAGRFLDRVNALGITKEKISHDKNT